MYSKFMTFLALTFKITFIPSISVSCGFYRKFHSRFDDLDQYRKPSRPQQVVSQGDRPRQDVNHSPTSYNNLATISLLNSTNVPTAKEGPPTVSHGISLLCSSWHSCCVDYQTLSSLWTSLNLMQTSQHIVISIP